MTDSNIETNWAPTRTGNWALDNAEGARLADELISEMRSTRNPILLGHQAKAIIAAGRYEGAEVGFFTQIAKRLLS